jgi:hypothetical protein
MVNFPHPGQAFSGDYLLNLVDLMICGASRYGTIAPTNSGQIREPAVTTVGGGNMCRLGAGAPAANGRIATFGVMSRS